MTCREKLAIEHPDKILDWCDGGCFGCPMDYGYLPKPDSCLDTSYTCTKCWDREIPEINNEKENDTMPIHAVREMTAAELLQKSMEYKKQAEIEKLKEESREAASELKAIQDGLVAAGFSEDQAFNIMLSMINMVIGKI